MNADLPVQLPADVTNQLRSAFTQPAFTPATEFTPTENLFTPIVRFHPVELRVLQDQLAKRTPYIFEKSYARGVAAYQEDFAATGEKVDFVQVLEGRVAQASGPIRVLDIGAASALFLHQLKAHFGKAIETHAFCLDPHPHFPVDHYHVGCAEYLPKFMVGMFDLVTSVKCLSSSNLPHKTLQAISGVLKLGGTAYLTDIHPLGVNDNELQGLPLLRLLSDYIEPATLSVMQENWTASRNLALQKLGTKFPRDSTFNDWMEGYLKSSVGGFPLRWAREYYLARQIAEFNASPNWKVSSQPCDYLHINPRTLVLKNLSESTCLV